MDANNKTYNKIDAYPIKLEKEINKKENKEKYTLENDDINLKINFVNEDYISFDYNLISEKLPITKYAVVKTDDLKSNSFMSINEFTGDKKSNEIFKKVIYDKISSNLSLSKDGNISYDYTNFGLVRNFGLWQMQSSYQLEKNDSLEQKTFPIELAFDKNFSNQNNKDITVDQIKNINGQARDYFELANGQYVAVQSPDEILFYGIKNGLIDPNPKFSIKLANSTQIIMFEQGLGSYAEKWEKTFNDNNIIIH
ncbi:conserved domain protein [Anaerococcus hydrogenalis ACS-025-V-Sch4]|uniref:Conserved domain protein n=2 Tax=Anaerococcus hydrogenalis TaxID=33029 RepID=F0GZB4_9FIRM|nr:conserved domain protein [Anaerococcus hydrogenalis ACS-025-V-Sch4]